MKNLIKKILREEIGYHIVSIQYLGRKPLNEGTNYEHIDDEILTFNSDKKNNSTSEL
jgi:hypothetical protein